MADGTRYDANKRGVVEVSDHHARHVRNSGNAEVGVVGTEKTTFTAARERTCPSCGFTCFAWQHVCPRCHTAERTEKEH